MAFYEDETGCYTIDKDGKKRFADCVEFKEEYFYIARKE